LVLNKTEPKTIVLSANKTNPSTIINHQPRKTISRMESRYTNRFRSIDEKTGTQIKNRDSAGNLTEHLTQAKGSISAQQKNIQDLFSTSREMITGINTHQSMMGTELVKNIPLPGQQIQQSPANQLGYVQLSMRFMQAGLLHFMEQVVNAQGRIHELEKTIERLAEYDEEISVLGQMNTLDVDSPELLGVTGPPSPPESVTSQPSVKSVKTPSTPTEVKGQTVKMAQGMNNLKKVDMKTK